MTTTLFRDDAYLKVTSASVLDVNDTGIVLNQTNFYAAGGGQPGDKGTIKIGADEIEIADTVYGTDKTTIYHVPANADHGLKVGDDVTLELDWDTRFNHMRMHTALHLLCSIIPFQVTGGSIGALESRLDFDMPETVDKGAVTEALMALVNADHSTFTRFITDDELDLNPDLVRTLSVQPPRGSGQIRLVGIGDNGAVDLQPCGGTHIKSTSEIGAIHIGKIEKKGKMNRRLRVRFGAMPT